jgi:hypothetical protein
VPKAPSTHSTRAGGEDGGRRREGGEEGEERANAIYTSTVLYSITAAAHADNECTFAVVLMLVLMLYRQLSRGPVLPVQVRGLSGLWSRRYLPQLVDF